MEMIVYTKYIDDVNRPTDVKYTYLDLHLTNNPEYGFEKLKLNYTRIDVLHITIISPKIFYYAVFKDDTAWRTVDIKPISNTTWELTLLYQKITQKNATGFPTHEFFTSVRLKAIQNPYMGTVETVSVAQGVEPEYLVIQTTEPLINDMSIGGGDYVFSAGWDTGSLQPAWYIGTHINFSVNSQLREFISGYRIGAGIPTYIVKISEIRLNIDFNTFINDLLRSNYLVSMYVAPKGNFNFDYPITITRGGVAFLQQKLYWVGSYIVDETSCEINTLGSTGYVMDNLCFNGKTITISSGAYHYACIPSVGTCILLIWDKFYTYDEALKNNAYLIGEYYTPAGGKIVDFNTYRSTRDLKDISKAISGGIETTLSAKEGQIITKNAYDMYKLVNSPQSKIAGGLMLGGVATKNPAMIGAGASMAIPQVLKGANIYFNYKSSIEQANLTANQQRLSIAQKVNNSGQYTGNDILSTDELLQATNIPLRITSRVTTERQFDRCSELIVEDDGNIVPITSSISLKKAFAYPKSYADIEIYSKPFVYTDNVDHFIACLKTIYRSI